MVVSCFRPVLLPFAPRGGPAYRSGLLTAKGLDEGRIFIVEGKRRKIKEIKTEGQERIDNGED